jgi:hypothetical protein
VTGPVTISPQLIFYNKELFDNAGVAYPKRSFRERVGGEEAQTYDIPLPYHYCRSEKCDIQQ